MLDNIRIDQMAANRWILWIITHSSKASIKWLPIDGSINCPGQSIDCPDPSTACDIYIYIPSTAAFLVDILCGCAD